MTVEKKPPQGAGNAQLYAGVEVMADRLEVGIYAFQTEARQVAALTLWVNPSQDEAWRLLHALLCAYPGLRAVGVDSGGHQTGQVYRFALSSNQPDSGAEHKVVATKNCSTRGSKNGLGSVLMDVYGPDHGSDEKIKILVLLVGLEDGAASPDVLRCARAACEWESLIRYSSPAMRLKPGNPDVTALRVQSCVAEAQLKKEAAGRATCPLARELLQAKSNLSFLRAKQNADHQTT